MKTEAVTLELNLFCLVFLRYKSRGFVGFLLKVHGSVAP